MTLAADSQPKIATPAEYLALEEVATERHDYRDGEVVPVPGGTVNHNRIARNLCMLLPLEVEEQIYEPLIKDVKVWIPAANLYTYPDVLLIAGEPIYHQDRQDVVTNPLLIAEVLSPLTRQYDQTDRFDAYRTLPSLQEYLLIESEQFWVKQFARDDRDRWVLTDWRGEEAVLPLAAVAIAIALRDLYRRVTFA